MDKTIKTYGVNGLMEWHARLPLGKTTLLVDFTGGSLTGYGVSPATYTTGNEVVQRVIESSRPYREGKIRLLRSVTQTVGATAKAREGALPSPAPAIATHTPSPRLPASAQCAPLPGAAPAAPAAAAPAGGQPDLFSYEATDEADAADYLSGSHGVAPEKLNSRADIFREASRLGITLTIDGDRR